MLFFPKISLTSGYINYYERENVMARLTILAKKKSKKKLTTMSVSINTDQFERFKKKCSQDLNLKHTDVIRHLVLSFSVGDLVIDLQEDG